MKRKLRFPAESANLRYTMEIKTDLAIVLRVTPHQERHQIVTALTHSHGKISALAKNSIHSRRFGGSLGPFTAAEWRFSQRPNADFYILSEARVKAAFDGLKMDLCRLGVAGVFNEIALRIVPEGENCTELFKLHSNALAALENLETGGGKEIALLNAYIGKVLQWSGNQPRISECERCEKSIQETRGEEWLFASIAKGGWVCADCRDSQETTQGKDGLFEIQGREMKEFVHYLRTPIRKCLVETQGSRHANLYCFLESFLIYHVPGFGERPIRSLKLLDLKSRLRPPAGNPR